MELSVVVPVYNESEVLPVLIERLKSVLETLKSDYEVIFVDDCSTDDTKKIIENVFQLNPRWKLISFSRNFGHQTAVSAGLHFSRGRVVVVMDADLQDPPEEIPRFIEKWNAGFKVVYAIRKKRKEGLLLRLCYWAFYRILKIFTGITIPLDSGDFCLMDRVVVDAMKSLPERTRFIRGLRSWVGFPQIGVEYERAAREKGETKYTFFKLLKLALDGIFSFSSFPLKFASWIGFFLWFVSIAMILFLALWWKSEWIIWGLQPRQVAGWTSLFSLVLFLSGLQILLIAFVGEYLSRIYDEVKQRSLWVISEKLGIE